MRIVRIGKIQKIIISWGINELKTKKTLFREDLLIPFSFILVSVNSINSKFLLAADISQNSY